MSIAITGATGFLGQHVHARLDGHPAVDSVPGRAVLDLRDPWAFATWLEYAGSTEAVIHCAYPGTDGIGTMLDAPADLVHDLLQIDLHVIDACARAKVQKLICFGSVCSYPETVTFPTAEDQLWLGYPEAVNAPYGNAKRLQLDLLRCYRRQYGLRGIQLILGNLYGPGDRSGHVIPATIRKVLRAQAADDREIVVWGDGTGTREFLFVEDAARAVILALDQYDAPDPINICSGEELSIRSLVTLIMELCDYDGAIRWDRTKPNGQPRRWFSRAKAAAALGWAPQVSMREGLARTIDWLRQEVQHGEADTTRGR